MSLEGFAESRKVGRDTAESSTSDQRKAQSNIDLHRSGLCVHSQIEGPLTNSFLRGIPTSFSFRLFSLPRPGYDLGDSPTVDAEHADQDLR